VVVREAAIKETAEIEAEAGIGAEVEKETVEAAEAESKEGISDRAGVRRRIIGSLRDEPDLDTDLRESETIGTL